MQFWDAFRTPSSNQRMCTSPVKLLFFTLVKRLIQWSRFACSRQNLSGSASEASYIRKYPASSTQALRATDSGTGKRVVFDMAFAPGLAMSYWLLAISRRRETVSPSAPLRASLSARSEEHTSELQSHSFI